MNQSKGRQKHSRWLNVCHLWFKVIFRELLLTGKKLCIYLYLGCYATVRFLRDIPPWKMAKGVFYISIFLLFCDIARTAYAWWPILLGYCYLPHHYWLVAGFLLFFAGSVAQVTPKEWLWKGRLKAFLLMFRALLFAVAVAGGGFITMYGWNERDNYINKQALLFAAAKEWKQNDMRNDEIEFTLSLIRQRDYKRRFPLPIPTNQELIRAIDLTQLEWRRIQQSPLDYFLLQYTIRIDFLSTRLYMLNIKSTTREKYRNGIDSIFGKGDAYPDYLEYHHIVEDIFRRKYPGFLERVDWLQLEIIDRSKEKAGETTEPADPNDQPDDNLTNN